MLGFFFLFFFCFSVFVFVSFLFVRCSSVCCFLVIEQGKDSKHGWCSSSSLCANNPCEMHTHTHTDARAKATAPISTTLNSFVRLICCKMLTTIGFLVVCRVHTGTSFALRRTSHASAFQLYSISANKGRMCQGFVSLDILGMDSVVPSSTLLLHHRVSVFVHLHSLFFFLFILSVSVFFVRCAHAILEDYYV